MDVPDIARVLIGAGAVLVVVGGLLWMSSAVIDWGNLPGDLTLRTGSTRIYVPLGTMLVVSVVFTLLLNLLLRMLR